MKVKISRHSKQVYKNMWGERWRLVKEVNSPSFGLPEAEREIGLLRGCPEIERIRWSSDLASFLNFFVHKMRVKYRVTNTTTVESPVERDKEACL